MINLLSTNDQRQLAAARTNSLILRYILMMSIMIVVLALEMLGVYFLLSSDKARNEAMIIDNQQKASGYNTVTAQANKFRSDLAISKYILDKQAPYSSLILAIAQALPTGAVLDGLSITPANFGVPTSLIVQTDTSETAIRVKTQLQDVMFNNKHIFSDVSFESISAPGAAAGSTSYRATYRVTYSKDMLLQ